VQRDLVALALDSVDRLADLLAALLGDAEVARVDDRLVTEIERSQARLAHSSAAPWHAPTTPIRNPRTSANAQTSRINPGMASSGPTGLPATSNTPFSTR